VLNETDQTKAESTTQNGKESSADYDGSKASTSASESIPTIESQNVTQGVIIRPPVPEMRDVERIPEVVDPWAVRGVPDAHKGSGRQLPWVIEELLLSQSATLVSAQPHAMKSLSWLAACMEAPLTGKVWGHFGAPKVDSTLFIETEDPQWLVEARIVGLTKGLGLKETDDIPGFHYVCVGPFDFLNEKDHITKIIEKHQPKFIVLSTLQNLLANRSWLSQQDMQPIMAAIIQFSRMSPIILVTHSPQDNSQRRAAGTITQAANFATLLHYQKTFSKTKGTGANVKMDSKAGMGGRTFSLKLVTGGPVKDPGSVRKLVYEEAALAGSPGKEAVMAELAADPSASASEIAERAEVSARYVQHIMKEVRDSRKQPRGVSLPASSRGVRSA
jgi:AAA domain